jgi:class 3 adenylate cyclase/predicted ATPase
LRAFSFSSVNAMDDVAKWLADIGLGEHAALFAEQNIDLSVVPDLTEQDLRDLGLSVGHRRRLLRAAAELKGPSRADQAFDAAHQDAAERRQLTVMFCDLTDSTALAAQLDPEDVREVIRAYQDACTDIVSTYGGFLAKFMGDGVLVYFGYPRAEEDDAERAVQAGLEIVAAIDRLDACRSVSVRVRVGIATGPVVVGDLVGEGTAQERSVIGETPNIAARLQASAEPGSVVIAASTRRLIGSLFDLRELGPKIIKGYSEPVAAWAVDKPAHVESRFVAMRSERLDCFVGREHEFDLLRQRQQSAWRGEGQIVLVSGEAGIGKSQLTERLTRSLEGTPHMRLRYQCSAYHINSALYPFIQQLKLAAGIDVSDPTEVQLDKLEALIALATPNVRNVAPLFGQLLSINVEGRYPPLTMTASERRRQTLSALLDQLEGLSRRQPILFVFEDLHWADATSHELLSLAVERIRHLPVFAIITSRPEFELPSETPNVTKLALDRFKAPQVREMVRWIAGGKELPADVVSEIIARTDGVPLFVEELTRSVLESGLLVESSGSFRLEGAQAKMAIPETLRDSLMARIDRLDAARQVAQVGAVIGRSFSYEMVATISEIRQVPLREALRKLVDAQLIYQRGAPPDAVYTFKHALVQDTAYESLLKSTRQALHARIVRSLEADDSDAAETDCELLARHCTGANLAEKAIAYWMKAGRRSLTESHLREAAPQLQAAIRLLSAQPDSVDRQRQELACEAMLAQAMIGTKGYGAAETMQAWTRARALASALGSAEHFFAATYGLWVGQYSQGHLNPALTLAEECLVAAEAAGDRTQLCVTHRMNGIALFVTGRFTRAREECARAVEYYDEAQHSKLANQMGHDLLAAAMCFKALSSWAVGLPDQAREAMDFAISHTKRLNHPPSLAYTYWHAGIMGFLMLRDEQRLAEHADALLALSVKHGFALWESGAHAAKGWLHAKAGGGSEAVDEVRGSVEWARKAQSRVNETVLLALLGDAQAMAGNASAGLTTIDEAIGFAETSHQTFWLSELQRLQGVLRLQSRADRREAEISLRQAMATARQQEALSWQMRAANDLARLLAADGRADEAHAVLTEPYSRFQEGFDTPDLTAARALIESLSVSSRRSSVIATAEGR